MNRPQGTVGKVLHNTIGRHPGATAVVLAVLVVLVVVIAVLLAHYKGLAGGKSGFGGPLGLWGPYGVGGAASAMGGAGGCAPGETPVAFQGSDGSVSRFCRNTNALPGPPTVCGAGWDPAASAEAEALATVGSLPHASIAEHRLQGAINAAYDSNLGMSDEQLTTLMHQGETP